MGNKRKKKIAIVWDSNFAILKIFDGQRYILTSSLKVGIIRVHDYVTLSWLVKSLCLVQNNGLVKRDVENWTSVYHIPNIMITNFYVLVSYVMHLVNTKLHSFNNACRKTPVY